MCFADKKKMEAHMKIERLTPCILGTYYPASTIINISPFLFNLSSHSSNSRECIPSIFLQKIGI